MAKPCLSMNSLALSHNAIWLIQSIKLISQLSRGYWAGNHSALKTGKHML